MKRFVPYIGFAVVAVVLVLLSWGVSDAFAEDGQASSESGDVSEAVASPDYSELLLSIDERLSRLEELATSQDVQSVAAALEDMPKSEDISALQTVVESIAPVDNTERLETLHELFTGLTSVSVFQWVTLLLLLGVLCALVFLVSYRSHT